MMSVLFDADLCSTKWQQMLRSGQLVTSLRQRNEKEEAREQLVSRSNLMLPTKTGNVKKSLSLMTYDNLKTRQVAQNFRKFLNEKH
ncbi:hypothetical protein NPIL_163061 [Nephila pilipes]|uniref:Uncharacterized protein n=1 Tax=Nephila pilipes TaxID=299642 RepID=A0A8X6Q8T8_NEPPI|nr:hypothetical protein NPIL_163061 [Nephila pilipes]